MNIKMSLHTTAVEDESVRYEQRDQERVGVGVGVKYKEMR